MLLEMWHSFFYTQIRRIGEYHMKYSKLILLLFLIGCLLCGCMNGQNIPDRFTEEEEKHVVFTDGYPEGFWARNDRGNGGMFNCSFSAANAKVENGYLNLILDNTAHGYAGAEFRTSFECGYGFYSVSMKPVNESGVITSFFIYNGRPWDEIDIEFLGEDTTKVQFNYFTDVVGGHEYVYDLGFDASEEFHEYAFEWKEGSITWYVDGKSVYTATKNTPSHAGHLMMNLWNVTDNKADWAGKFECEEFPLIAQYEWIGISSVLSTENK